MLQYIIAFLGVLSFAFFLYKKPKIETYVLFIAFALPIIDAKTLPLAYGFVKVFDVVSVLTVILFFKDFISFKSSSKGKIYLVLVLSFWVLLLLSKLNSKHPLNNLYFLYQPFTIFIYARFFLIYLERKKDVLLKFIPAFQISVLILAGIVFIQLLVGPTFTYLVDLNPNVINEESGLIRYPSLFQDSQTCGQFLSIASFSLLLFKPTEVYKRKRLFFFAFISVAVAIFLAGSRSALGGWAIGVFIIVLTQNTKVKTMLASIGILAGVIFIILAPKDGIFGRTKTLSEDFLFRQSIWQETGDIIEQNPMLGIGLGNFQKHIKRYKQDLFLQTEDGGDFLYFDQPENGYLKILVEQGYFGFITFILLIIIPILGCLKNVFSNNGGKFIIIPIAAVLTWAVAFNTVYSLFDYRILVALATFLSILIYNGSNVKNIKQT